MHVTGEMVSPSVPQTLAHFATVMGRRLSLWAGDSPLNVNWWRGKRILSARMGDRVPVPCLL